MRRWVVALAAVLVTGALAADEPGVLDTPVVLVGRLHCAPVAALATALGGQAAVTADARAAKLTVGQVTLELRYGRICASGPQGLLLLPTVPFLREGNLFVPTRAVVEYFGCDTSTAGGAFRVLRQGQLLAVLPKAVEPPPPTTAAERLQQALSDPRVALDVQSAGLSRADTGWRALEGFNKVAGTAKPVLEEVANSKTLRLARRIPLAGQVLGLAQDITGSLSEAVGLSHKLGDYDQAKLAPVRRALEQTVALQGAPTPERAAATQPAWREALPALEGQIADCDQLIRKLWMLDLGLKLFAVKVQEAQRSYTSLNLSAGLQPLEYATEQCLLSVRGMRWERATLKDYFTRLSAVVDQGAG